jgi:DNA-binding NarL/FixJ family response regulator
MSRTRVLVADDNSLARRAVRALIKQDPELEVVGEAKDGLEALTMAKDLMPDLILMDINMPRCDGLLATRLIKRELPYAVVVMLTVSDDATDLFEAVRSGAQGYLLKSLDQESRPPAGTYSTWNRTRRRTRAATSTSSRPTLRGWGTSHP